MKIVLFIDSLGPGGAQRQFVGLANMLAELHHEVIVVTYHDIPFYKNHLDKFHIKIENIEDGGSYTKRVWHFGKIIRAYHPQWIISYLESPSVIASLCHLFGGVDSKLMVSERNTTQKLTLKDRIRFWLYRFADVIVCNSFSQKKYIDKHYPYLSSHNTVIPNFVDLGKFVPANNRVRGNVIIVAATISESKNTLGFVEAVRIARERGVKLLIKWYGISSDMNPYVNKCLKKIAEYGIDDCFFLLNKTKEIENEYRNADYFCLPSFYEGTPNALCEAMACGLPVLCSNVCDNEKYVNNGINGFLFNPNDPNDMALKIDRMLSLSDTNYSKFCCSSRTIAQKYFNQSVFIDKYLKILESI